MRVAIIGAGFCGLATAWHLSQISDFDITLFDAKGIGNGASGVAAGLLHPYPGAHAKEALMSTQGIDATLNLIAVAEKTLGVPLITSKGLLRLALTPQQHADFSLCAEKHRDVHWRSINETQASTPSIIAYPGIFIDSAFVVDCKNYLQGLWKACEKEGIRYQEALITTLSELKEFDQIVVAGGAQSTSIEELSTLPLTPVKGQILEFNWPEHLSPLSFPVNSHTYLLMHPNAKTCLVGATYERQFSTPLPMKDVAIRELMPKVKSFFPHLEESNIINCSTGIRASTPDHKPLLSKISSKTWILSGMGSKGLLYHALYGKELARRLTLV